MRRDGSRMTRRSADRVVKRCATAAGIVAIPVSPHTLRHTFVVLALDAGVPPRTVQLSARHAELSTRLNTYDRGRQVLDDHASYAVAGCLGFVP
ncbi:tyrosine-type recombinase/integrase [Gordonia sp. AC31]|uniref:tyrosine-type recombinase/integrase n=1 Tax=Gordonia sp. AC31 TaxID=2962571 RepID=UPI002880CDEC|nr:tyrosine-type recombinase/integrase [Gordonia sp. AC31]MDT0223433.1 tyrosine-type recombinase/integrase [Gordonia sp. AC31]